MVYDVCMDRVHIVTNGVVLAAYRSDRLTSAEAHARCVTGAVVQTFALLEQMPESVIDDVGSDEWDGDDTPTEFMKPPKKTNLDATTTPDSPRAMARRRDE